MKNKIDFNKIKWSKIDREKADFFYNEAIARLESIHKNNDSITNKALSMLSFSVPVLTALIGYFILQWGAVSFQLRSVSVCSIVFLFAILILLLFVLLPKGFSSAQGEPSSYFTDDYYLNSMLDILKGNIQALQQSIDEDMAVQKNRATLFRIAVVLFTVYPVVTVIVWVVTSFCIKQCWF